MSLMLFLPALMARAQDEKTDFALVHNHAAGSPEVASPLNTLSPLGTKRHGALARYNPVTLTLTGMMLLYQHVISPQISASCIYTRSCSNFAKQAIREYGVVKGVFITADRLMRCNHLCEEDFPSYAYTPEGKINDEPSLYRKR